MKEDEILRSEGTGSVTSASGPSKVRREPYDPIQIDALDAAQTPSGSGEVGHVRPRRRNASSQAAVNLAWVGILALAVYILYVFYRAFTPGASWTG